ncbi:MAG: secretin N-terminal domain-containing protein [Planctomycetota bacterium]
MTNAPVRILVAVAVLALVSRPATLRAQQGESPRSAGVELDVDEASIEGVLRLLARKYGLSLVVAPGIQGTVSAHFEGVPVEEALESLAASHGLVLRRNGGVIEVLPAPPPEAEASALPALPVTDESRVYRLSYGEPAEVAASLAVLVPEGGVVANKANRSVVVRAPSATHDRVHSVIQALDLPRRQVRIEAKILETVVGNADELGIDWNIAVSMFGAQRPTTFPFDKRRQHGIFWPMNNLEGSETNVTTGDFSSTTTNASAFSPDSSFPLANRQDFTFGSLDFTQFQAVLKAIQTQSDTRIKGQPEITVAENGEAKIEVGQTVPVPTYTRNEQWATTTISGYQEIEVGTSLVVTPHINADGTITLLVAPEVSGILSFTGPFKDLPVTYHRRAQTEVTLSPGRTLVIGGLVSERTVERRSQVPLLGSIPLLGELFSFRSTEIEKTDLYIFITPKLVDPDAESSRKSGLEKLGEHWLPAAEAARWGQIMSGIGSPHAAVRAISFDEAVQPADAGLRENLGLPQLAERAAAKDPSAAVRASALRALLVRWPERALLLLDELVDAREVAVLPVLAALALEEEPLPTRTAVVAAMGSISGEESERLLTTADANEWPRHARARLECLGLLGRESSVPFVRSALSDPEEEIVRHAQTALGAIGGPEAASALACWLRDHDPSDPLYEPGILALRDALGGTAAAVESILSPDPAIPLGRERREALVRALARERDGQRLVPGPRRWLTAEERRARPGTPEERGRWSPKLKSRLEAAITLLARDAPPYHHGVARALEGVRLVPGGDPSRFDGTRIVLSESDLESWATFDLAHQLVRFATQSRLEELGNPWQGPRAERLAFREQYIALRLLAGDVSPGQADINAFLDRVQAIASADRGEGS